jgi:hypothetical protein
MIMEQRYVVLFFLLGVLISISSAQTDSVSWALTADTNSIVHGNLSAGGERFSSMVARNYNGGVCQKCAPDAAGTWPAETGENISRYIQFSVSPAPNYNVTIMTVRFYIGWAGTTNHMSANAYYSTDPTFASKFQLGTTISLQNSIGVFTSYPLNVVVNDGNTFYVRIYPWDNAAATGKSCGLFDFCIEGSAVSTVTSSFSTNPSTLSFGTININTSKEKTFILSGLNLVPSSGNILVTAPTGFEVSTTHGSGFTSSLSLPYSGGSFYDTTVVVRFSPTTVSVFSDSIAVSGGGAMQNVFVSGTSAPSDSILGIFVSPMGSDSNSGTFVFPFATISKAISVAQSGDTIFVRGGAYELGGTINLSLSGTDSNSRHCLFSYGNERPILDFSSMFFGSGNRGINLSGSYWHIKGFDICKAGDNGMNISGSNNIIELCALFENRDTGLQLSGTASNNHMINCDSFFNYDDSSATPGGNADGFAPKQLTGINNYFYGCRAWQNSDDGWDCFEAVASVTIEHCWTFNNGYLKDGVTTNDFMNGNGFKLGGNYTENDATLMNCLAFENKAKGFDQNHNRGSMTFLNCTGYANSGNNYALVEALDAGKTLTLTNCNELGNKRSIGAFAVLTTNSWQAFTVTAADFTSIDTSGVRGQRKPDGSLPDVSFMHLAHGSQLIDAGTNVGLPYHGSAPDLGCFESDYATGVKKENDERITEFQLFQNYPNPFNPSTELSYSTALSGVVQLSVYDLLGQEVATLVHEQKQPGNYSIQWNAAPLSSGIYFARLSVYTQFGRSFTQTRKMLLTK